MIFGGGLFGNKDAAARAGTAFSLVGTDKNGAAENRKSDGMNSDRTDLLGAERSALLGSQAGLELHGRFSMREASKEEIMADMTVDKAYDIFMRMNRSLDASLVDLIESKFGHSGYGKGGQNLRHVQKHAASRKYDALSGLYTARDMLNAMMDETITNKEVESEKCENYERDQLRVIWESQQDIDYVSAQAADARAASLRAAQIISVITDTKVPNLNNQISQNTGKCDAERNALNGQIALVKADMDVLKNVFSMMDCTEVPMQTLMPPPIVNGTQTVLLATAHDAEDGSLVQCPACAAGARPVVQVRQARVQAQLQKLRSEVAKEYVREHLQEAFLEIERREPTKIRRAVLIQAAGNKKKGQLPGEEMTCNEDMGSGVNGSSYRGCQDVTVGGVPCQKWNSEKLETMTGVVNMTQPGNQWGLSSEHSYCRNPAPGRRMTIWCYTETSWDFCERIEMVEAPAGLPQHECVSTSGCKIGPGSCERMRDRFIIILAGVNDKIDQLTEDLAKMEAECLQVHQDLNGAVSALNVQQKEEETNLAAAQKTIQESTSQKNLATKAHTEYVKDYHDQMKECCDNKNGFLAELCGLEKLRGELFRMENQEVTITDCEVGDWTDSECTATCEGGTQERKRDIIARRVNGTNCPPMTQERDCNTQKCPIDCTLSVWSEWTECTAICAGGVRTRMRDMTQRPKYDGKQCEEVQQTEQCNIQSCNEDCVLGDWAEWTGCSKACNTGHRERRTPVKVEARGQGTCASPESELRLDFEECNAQTCMEFLADSNVSQRSTLECISKLDVTILMDASGSLLEKGFNQSKLMAQRIVSAMQGGEDLVKIAFLMFGGPNTLEAYEKCTSSAENVDLDVQFECGMHWVARWTSDMAKVAARVAELPYPISTTMTSMALAEAKTEITSGRQEADSVVVVITDAKPMSNRKTTKAAEEMKKDARLIWVPIGETMPKDLDNIKAWASKPWEDNVVPIPDIDSMANPKELNSIIASICPSVK